MPPTKGSTLSTGSFRDGCRAGVIAAMSVDAAEQARRRQAVDKPRASTALERGRASDEAHADQEACVHGDRHRRRPRTRADLTVTHE